MSVQEVKVPDIGDFKEVEIIEILVKEGDRVAVEQSLISVESDKASMEIPSPVAGVVSRLLVKLGDKVSEGVAIAVLEVLSPAEPAGPARASDSETQAAPARPNPAPSAVDAAGAADPADTKSSRSPGSTAAPPPAGAGLNCQVVVIGSGPGGYAAAFRAADLGLTTVLVERYATLGGVCLNVGCIPSKALLHVAAVIDEAEHLAQYGVVFGAPQIDIDALRSHKSTVVRKLTSGLTGMAKGRKVTVIQGSASFLDANHLTIETSQGEQTLGFEHAIIAAGSSSIRLPFAPDDARVVDSTGALELRSVPKKMLIIGGGIIGLEMGTVYSTLGARLDVVEMQDALMPGADRDLVRVWMKMNQKRFDRIMLKTRTVAIEARDDGVWVRFEGTNAPTEAERYDLVLQAVGRKPNGLTLSAERAGVAVGERGFIAVDGQMRTNVAHIFAIGDIVGQPMLAHKATHQGHVAAEAVAGQKSFFDARVIPSVAYTDPEIAWVGTTEDEATAQGVAFERAVFPWAASGRAIANGREEGFTKLLFDPVTHRLIGGAIVGPQAGDLISELALAVEMGADAVDIGQTIHPHPTLGETTGLAAELYEGVCTDLPVARKSKPGTP